MIRYYAYYSVGGYKDLYLGNNEMNEQATYYLPLMAIWRKKAESNPEYARKLEECTPLPKIKVATINDMFGLPQKAADYFVHGGYKELLSKLSDGECVLIIRDLENNQKDDSGRNIPFLFAFVADTPQDASILIRIAAYAAARMKKTTRFLSDSLGYDAQYNGLRFNLKEVNEWVAKTASSYPAEIAYNRGIKALNVDGPGVHFISIPKGLTAEYVFGEIGEPIVKEAVFTLSGLYDASDKEMRTKAMKEAEAYKKMRLYKHIGIIGASAASVSALLIWYFTHKQ